MGWSGFQYNSRPVWKYLLTAAHNELFPSLEDKCLRPPWTGRPAQLILISLRDQEDEFMEAIKSAD